MNPILRSLALAIVITALGGCSIGPDYRRPDTDLPPAWKEAGTWKPAEPRDAAPAGPWWQVYGDPQLDGLLAEVAVSNQNVQAAAAQYRQALALLGTARAARFPLLSADLSANRAAAADLPAANTDRLGFTATWEADVWGRLSRGVEAGEANAAASAADLQAALLSAQATLAQSYLQLRVTDVQTQVLVRTIASYTRSLEITRNRYRAGVASRLDVAQAEAQLKSTEAQAIDLGLARAQLEHAIALLVGKAPARLSVAASDTLPASPELPLLLPSELLERRPDVAAAERRVAAANAQIGVAQGAFFPTLALGASAGYQGSGFGHLLSAPNRFWSLGPALALTLFDGGARRAQKEQAVAAWEQTVANYRQTVLTGFQEVEDNLAALRLLDAEIAVQSDATRAAQESLALAENQYKAGIVSYLNVIVAQATAQAAETGGIALEGRRLAAGVALLKAIGGDWRVAAAP